jgi:sugar fermentation stimulation protein A
MLAFERALQLGLIPWARGLSIERRSPRFGSSVFDYLLSNSGGAVVEVKSAALRIGRCASYPDCPSERAKRQLSDLATLPQRRKIIVFIAAVPGVRAFRLNWSADPELCAVIERIARRGVELRSIHVVYSEPRVLLLDPDLVVRLEVPRR